MRSRYPVPVPEALSSAVAAVVRRLCDERQMSGNQLAKATGIPQSSISRKLSPASSTALDLDDVQKISEALGVDVADLMKWAQD